MTVYISRDGSSSLAHYGVKGMKWRKHLKAQDVVHTVPPRQVPYSPQTPQPYTNPTNYNNQRFSNSVSDLMGRGLGALGWAAKQNQATAKKRTVDAAKEVGRTIVNFVKKKNPYMTLSFSGNTGGKKIKTNPVYYWDKKDYDTGNREHFR